MPGGTDDKPFRCYEHGCGQTFTNEDHLNVHKLKHQMSLTLTPGIGNKFLYADQTPTPTKFLRYGEEIGLFNELTKNPFDEAFKTASESNSKGKISTPTSENLVLGINKHDQDTLNTPTPHLQYSCRQPDTPDTPIKKRYRFLDPVTEPVTAESIPLPGPVATTDNSLKNDSHNQTLLISAVSSADNISGPSSQESSNLQIDDDTVFVPEASEVTTVSSQSLHLDSNYAVLDNNIVPSVSPQLIVKEKLTSELSSQISDNADVKQMVNARRNQSSGNSITQSDLEKTNLPILPVGNICQSVPVTSDSKISSITPQYMLQVMIQTPEGNMMPVQIPASLATSNSPLEKKVTSGNILSPKQDIKLSDSTSAGTLSTNASVLTKRKLKEAIQQNSPSGNVSFISSPVGSRTTSTSSCNSPTSQNSNMQALSRQQIIEYQAADSSVSTSNISINFCREDDSEEKRRKFLERNRAAATRCRNKKKTWVQNLEHKAEELQATNTRLQNEVTQLRAEMAQLKALLLAHKDCPITIQQRNAGQLNIQRASNTDSSDVQMVPVANQPIVANITTQFTKSSSDSSKQQYKPLAHIINMPQSLTVKNELIATTSMRKGQNNNAITIHNTMPQMLPQGQFITVPTATGIGQIVAVDLSQVKDMKTNLQQSSNK